MGARENSFVAYVLDQLREIEGLGCRAMFGGHGLYRSATFFGIVSEGRLYLKTDRATVGEYMRRGMRPFRPNDRQLLKTYYEVPADVLEDRSLLAAWAEAAANCADSMGRDVNGGGVKRSEGAGAGGPARGARGVTR